MSSAAAVAPRYEQDVSHQPVPSPISSAVLVGVTVLLFGAPLAFGAVEPWAIFLLETGAVLLFMLWAVQQLRSGELNIIGNPLYRPVLAFGVLVLLQVGLRHTANRTETLSAGLLYIAYGMLCFLVVQSLRCTTQLRILAGAISVYGTAIAIFAFIYSLTSNNKLYWVRTPRFGGWIYGPYVNHNHYAGLMEMLAPIPLIVSFSKEASRRQRIMAAGAAAIMASTIFLSGSRGGMMASTGQMILLTLFRWRHRKNVSKLAWVGVAIAALGVLFWVGGDDLVSRLSTIPQEAQHELSGGTRTSIDRDALRMFVQRPILGWGLGTFADVYPQYRSFSTNFALDKAHNDYLQLLVETGAPGCVTMLWFLILVYRTAAHNLRRPENHAFTLAATVGIAGILIHSLVDFNLQIPANAAWFYVLCVVAAMERPREHHKIAPRSI